MRNVAVLLVAALVVLSGCAGVVPTDAEDPLVGGDDEADTPAPTPTNGSEGVTTPPPDFSDPESDTLGWEGGYWYNESIDVEQEDGLNDEELAKVVNRSMARVEYVRGLEFEKPVPVEILTREEFRAEQSNRTTPETRRTFDNVKFEALFMINESTDSIDTQNTNTGTAVGGYYSPSEERIVVVSDSPDSPRLSEITLSQELFHALQDQKFDLGKFNQSTRERHNAVDGIVEGDGNYVDYLYEQQCAAEWDCLTDTRGGGGGGGLANIGPYLVKYQPYSDGPAFVRGIRERGGWEAVNAVYRNPPQSTEQVIHPDRYPDDEPRQLTLTDRTSGAWDRVRPEGRVAYAELGEAGVAAMLVYPLYTEPGTAIVPPQEWLNRNESGGVSEFDPLNYANRYSDGLTGDRMAVYRNGEGETGYVWKLAWEDEGEASEFLDGYEQLLEYRNASAVDAGGPGTTYRIPEDDPNGFADAFRVVQNDDTVIITNAPRVEDLDAVRSPN
jgi:hypothetical protein